MNNAVLVKQKGIDTGTVPVPVKKRRQKQSIRTKLSDMMMLILPGLCYERIQVLP